jgi:hypothetical protein
VKKLSGSNFRGEDIKFAGTVLELEAELALIRVPSFSFMLLQQPSLALVKSLSTPHTVTTSAVW